MRRFLSLCALVLLTACSGRPTTYWLPTRAARPTLRPVTAGPALPALITPDSVCPVAASSAPGRPLRHHPPPGSPARPVVAPRRPPLAARLLGRRLARTVAAASAHAPASHAGDGLFTLFLLALGLLALIVVSIVLAVAFSGTTLGTIGAWILYGLLVAAVLGVAYLAFG